MTVVDLYLLLMITAPPGPPTDFRADFLSDNAITLRWGSSVVTDLVYSICIGASRVCEHHQIVSVCSVSSLLLTVLLELEEMLC